MEKKHDERSPLSEEDANDSSVGIPMARKSRVKGKNTAYYILTTNNLYPSHYADSLVAN